MYCFEIFILYIYNLHEAVETYLSPEWRSCKALWDAVKPCIDISACYDACLKVVIQQDLDFVIYSPCERKKVGYSN